MVFAIKLSHKLKIVCCNPVYCEFIFIFSIFCLDFGLIFVRDVVYVRNLYIFNFLNRLFEADAEVDADDGTDFDIVDGSNHEDWSGRFDNDSDDDSEDVSGLYASWWLFSRWATFLRILLFLLLPGIQMCSSLQTRELCSIIGWHHLCTFFASVPIFQSRLVSPSCPL